MKIVHVLLLIPCVYVLFYIPIYLSSYLKQVYHGVGFISFNIVHSPFQKHLSDQMFACPINTLRPRQNGQHFLDNIFKCIFMNENI